MCTPPLGTLTRYIKKKTGEVLGHSHNGICREHVLYFSLNVNVFNIAANQLMPSIFSAASLARFLKLEIEKQKNRKTYSFQLNGMFFA